MALQILDQWGKMERSFKMLWSELQSLHQDHGISLVCYPAEGKVLMDQAHADLPFRRVKRGITPRPVDMWTVDNIRAVLNDPPPRGK